MLVVKIISNSTSKRFPAQAEHNFRRWLSKQNLYILNAIFVVPTLLFIVAYHNKSFSQSIDSVAIAFLPLIPYFWIALAVYILDLVVLGLYVIKNLIHRNFTQWKYLIMASSLLFIMATALALGASAWNKSSKPYTEPLLSRAQVLTLLNSCAIIGFSKQTSHKYGNQPGNNVIHFFPDQSKFYQYLPNQEYTEYTSIDNWSAMVDAAKMAQTTCGYSEGPT